MKARHQNGAHARKNVEIMTKKEFLEELSRYPDEYEVHKGYSYIPSSLDRIDFETARLYCVYTKEVDGKIVIIVQ